MDLEKTLVAEIDIEDPISFQSNEDANIMAVLTNIYVNKCFQGVFIKDIKKINEKSFIYMNSTNNKGYGFMTVDFTVNAIKYATGDILVGVVIGKLMENSVVTGQYKNIINVAMLPTVIKGGEPEEKFVFKPDSIITAVIESCECEPGKNIVAVCRVFVPRVHDIKFRIDEELSIASKTKIDNLISQIDEELKIRATHDAKKVLLIERIYHPTKMDTKEVKKLYRDYTCYYKVTKDEIDFLDFLSTPSTGDSPKSLKGVYSRSPTMFRSSPLVVKETTGATIVYTAEVGVCYLLSDILKHLKFINEFMTVYDEKTLALPSTKYMLNRILTS